MEKWKNDIVNKYNELITHLEHIESELIDSIRKKLSEKKLSEKNLKLLKYYADNHRNLELLKTEKESFNNEVRGVS